MKRLRIEGSMFLLMSAVSMATAGDFATDAASPWNNPYRRTGNYAPVYGRYPDAHAAYYDRFARNQAVAKASYWVERDPRYQPALPSVSRTSYRPRYSVGYPLPGDDRGDDWRSYGYGVDRQRSCATPPPTAYGDGYGYYAKPPVRSPNVGPLPRNYYKGDGLFGKDTVYAKDQPIRNFFRFLAP